jgi:TRAP transporter TAXI family solute receptor
MTATPFETFSIGAMPPGTSWYVFAATLAQLLEKELPPELSIEIMARGGGTGNPTLVQREQITIGLSQQAAAVWARDGHALAFRGRKHPDLRALVGGLNSVWVTAMLREEYIAQTGRDTLEKALLSGDPPRIVMKPPGSTVPIAADIIFEALGTSREDIERRGGSIIQVSTNQIPDILRDGRADLYFETAIKGHPTVTEVATTAEVRFIDLPDDVLEKLARQGMKPSPLPVWFKGQSRPTKAVDCGTVLIAHKNLPEQRAYLIAKTLCENREAMIRAHKAWTDFEPSRSGSTEATGIALHPGAERYFRERSWL